MIDSVPKHHLRNPLFPTCDGAPATSLPADDPLRLVKLLFLEAYFQVNRSYEKLCHYRALPDSERPLGRERSLLRRLEKNIVHKEQLEDAHAPRGIIAIPVYQNGYTVDLHFSVPGEKQTVSYYLRSSASVTMTFAIPRPE